MQEKVELLPQTTWHGTHALKSISYVRWKMDTKLEFSIKGQAAEGGKIVFQDEKNSLDGPGLLLP